MLNRKGYYTNNVINIYIYEYKIKKSRDMWLWSACPFFLLNPIIKYKNKYHTKLSISCNHKQHENDALHLFIRF